MNRHVFAVAAAFLLACTAESNVPFCPTGAVVHGDAVCGTCTQVHAEGECPPEYVCTCSLECVWFEHGFPIDAGNGCGYDGGIPDAN